MKIVILALLLSGCSVGMITTIENYGTLQRKSTVVFVKKLADSVQLEPPANARQASDIF
jgi:hypothetical protein